MAVQGQNPIELLFVNKLQIKVGTIKYPTIIVTTLTSRDEAHQVLPRRLHHAAVRVSQARVRIVVRGRRQHVGRGAGRDATLLAAARREAGE